MLSPLKKETFFKIISGEQISSTTRVMGYKFFKTEEYKVVDKIEDRDLFIKIKGYFDKVLCVRIQGGIDSSCDVVFINKIPHQLLDVKTYSEGDYVYFNSEYFNDNEVTEVLVYQSSSDVFSNISISNTPYLVNNTSPTDVNLVIGEDGRIFSSGTTTIGRTLRLSITIPHYQLYRGENMLDTNKNAFFNDSGFIIGNSGIGLLDVGGAHKIGYPVLGEDLLRINKYVMLSMSCDIVYAPIEFDSYSYSYYKKFFNTNYNKIKAGYIDGIDIMDANFKDVFDNLIYYYSRFDSIFDTTIPDMYKKNIGVYEKMIIRDASHIITSDTDVPFTIAGFKNSVGRDVSSSLGDNYMCSNPMLHIIVPNDNKNPLEWYINGRLLHSNPLSYQYCDTTHVYFKMTDLFDTPVSDLYNVLMDIIPEFKNKIKIFYDSSDVIRFINNNIEVIKSYILNNFKISAIKKRLDYRRFDTGFNVNRNIVCIPDIKSLNGVSVFADGFEVRENEYYLEYINGVLSMILKREYLNNRVPVTITYYKDPITIYERSIPYTKDIFENIMTSHYDEIYLNGVLQLPGDVYTPNIRDILLTTETDTTIEDDKVILVKSYVDKSIYQDYINTDYRVKLTDNLALISDINARYSIKRNIGAKSRYHDDKSLQEYIFYYKYILANEQNVDRISDIDLSPDEITYLRGKYDKLLDADNNMRLSNHADYPRDIVLGRDNFEFMDAAMLTKTKKFLEDNAENPYVSDTNTNTSITIDMNYKGQAFIEVPDIIFDPNSV